MKNKAIFITIGVLLSALMWAGLIYLIIPKPQPIKQEVYNPPNALEIEYLVNVERAKEGKHQLIHSDLLEQSACLKADDMLRNDYFAHNSPNGTDWTYFFNTVGASWSLEGENLSLNSTDKHPTSQGHIKGWMGSRLHRENILKDYTYSGVCVKKGHLQGKESYVIVQHFGIPN
jgi:uncharacterized protein YkwD